MNLRHSALSLFACTTLATAAIGCDQSIPTEAPQTTLASLEGESSPIIEASAEELNILTNILEAERSVRLSFEGVRNDHILLVSTFEVGSQEVTEVLNFRADRIDASILQILEEEGEVTAMLMPSLKADAFRISADINNVTSASADEAAARILDARATSLCGSVVARAETLLTLGGETLKVTANFMSGGDQVKKGDSVIHAVPCLKQHSWTGGSCAHEGASCSRIFNRAKRIMRQGCAGGSSGGSVGGGVGVGVGVKPGQKPGVGVDVEVSATHTYSVQWWEHSTSEQEERAFLGQCDLIDNGWAFENYCVCRLSHDTVKEVIEWQNQALPEASCTQASCTPNGAPTCGG